MIQRIQTVYLLLAAILTGMLSLLPLAHGITADTTLCAVSIWGFTAPAPTPDSYSGSWLNLAAGLVSIVTVLLALITIFLYRKRPLQKRLCNILFVLLILLCAAVSVYLIQTAALFKDFNLSVICGFPVIAFILTILARRGVVRDEKLVRSLDRIR